MEQIFIYVLRHPITLEIRYVGKTSKSLRTRYNQHIYEAKKGRFLRHKNNWIKSLLDEKLAPRIELLEVCNKINWEEREKYWIATYRALGLNLCNIRDGGEGEAGYTLNSEVGKAHSIKLRKIKGRKTYQYDLEGNFIAEYSCAIEAAEKTGTRATKISRVCLKKAYSANKFFWSFEKKDVIEVPKAPKKIPKIFVNNTYVLNKSKKVIVTLKNGEKLIFNTITEFRKKFNVSKNRVADRKVKMLEDWEKYEIIEKI
jgi:hypothetical protein